MNGRQDSLARALLPLCPSHSVTLPQLARRLRQRCPLPWSPRHWELSSEQHGQLWPSLWNFPSPRSGQGELWWANTYKSQGRGGVGKLRQRGAA